MLQLDHIMYAVPDLTTAGRDIARALGVQPAYGGPHPGRGTHNALLSLGRSQYLEVIAPDPSQAGAASIVDGVTTAHVKTWAVATDNLTRVAQICDEQGLGHNKQTMARTTPAGPTLNWELLFVAGHGYGDLFPFFIDWLESPHPSATTLQGGSLESFIVQTREPERYRALLTAFDIGGIAVVPGPDRLSAKILAAAGSIAEI